MRWLTSAALILGWAVSAQAHTHAQLIEYRHGETVLEGYLVYDEHIEGRRPGVLVVHEWKGLNDYAKRRAEQLAELGYLAFAVDMYGKGVRAKDHAEAAELSGVYRNDRQLLRGRIAFGGTTVLELARSGADVVGVVSFHGGLDTLDPQDARQIKGKVLVLHGANDTFVTAEQVAAFEEEMKEAGVDYRLVTYPGAVHSFTVPEAGDDPSKGMAYHAEADRQSWLAMQQFLIEVFK
jgi:dienelactone hydrolase